MGDEELLKSIKLKLSHIESNLSDDEISSMALEFVKTNKMFIVNRFLQKYNNSREAIFLAGSAGAGKSEFATSLSNFKPISIIDTDEIRKLFSNYNGANSYLFQKASSKGVDILYNEAMKKGISFVLDGNFSNKEMQRRNIKRALDNGFNVSLHFIYRPLDVAKTYTKLRELKEGRKVPDEIFFNKFVGAIETTQAIVEEFSLQEHFSFYDIENEVIYRKNEALEQFINTTKQDYKIAQYKLSNHIDSNDSSALESIEQNGLSLTDSDSKADNVSDDHNRNINKRRM